MGMPLDEGCDIQSSSINIIYLKQFQALRLRHLPFQLQAFNSKQEKSPKKMEMKTKIIPNHSCSLPFKICHSINK